MRAVRSFGQCFPPDFLGFLALAAGPQYFTKVRGDFRIRISLVGLPEVLQSLGVVTQPVLDPAHAVEYGGIFGQQDQRLLDLAQRFLVAVGAIRQGVAERIERLAVLGVAGENGAQIPFQHVNAVEPLGYQRPGVQ